MGDASAFGLSTSIEMSGEQYLAEQAQPTAPIVVDIRPVLRCDLPLPTAAEMRDDGGAAALIARSREVRR